jgi:DNA helicase-2/ATP-dependent DNA helicase PcrA
MRTVATQNPNWRLEEMAREIRRAAENERQFMALDETTAGYTPRPGRVTVATMHRAKGLEWDRVYLLGVNAYDFPSGSDEEFYRGESWWVADRLNVVEEAKAQLDALHREADLPPPPGDATREARLGYVEERLRLLYVGITRARRELILTANSGNREGDPVAPALPFLDLLEFTRTARAAPGAAKGPVPPP